MQGYIEWNIATGTLNTIKFWTASSTQQQNRTSPATVVCTGLGFYAFDALSRDMQRSERRRTSSGKPISSSMSNTLQTFQSVTIIMFTNSLVSWCMDAVSAAAGTSNAHVGNAFATVVCGLVVARTIVQLLDSASLW